MLNIITSLSIEGLINDMLDKIEQHWRDPFVSPIIIFPDSKTEQWFKLHALAKHQSVLMNLQAVRLESFLFDMLKTDDNQSLLSPDLLRDIIIKKLLSTENGQCYATKIKDFDNIGNYLNIVESTDNIKYKHLFDFANDLSKLFIEYEATRENIDAAIQDKEKNWQKKLYRDIISPEGIEFNNRRYYTCPQLATLNRQKNNGKIVFKEVKTPVFVVGFSGMGQTYRKLLSEFGKTSNLYVYLQTVPNKTENESVFLKHWARFGNTNCKLFDTPCQVLNTPDAYKNNTTLGKIQNAIVQDKNIENVEELKVLVDEHGNKIYDQSLTITSVPSKIKELEIVHSSICKLLKNKKENVTLKDILVFAPDISEYKSAIITVFNQVDPDNKEYPFVPFSIVDYCGINSYVLDALQTLYSILQNGGLNRKLFFDFTKNCLIQTRYKITDDDIANVFQKWIDSMRVYRVHEQDGTDDWEKAVYRLLIAKLTDNDEMEPFSDISTENNELLAKFVQIVYDINNNWLKIFKDKILLKQDDITTLQAFLKDLFALDNDDDSQQIKEKVVYKKIDRKLEQYKEFNTSVPMDCVMLSLIDIASNVKFSTGDMFTRGVTFTSLKSNRILPARYVFLLGMSSDAFPGNNKKTVLDGRQIVPQNGDDDIPGKNKNAFLCQLMATGDELHLSFVDKDLQTNNEFYPSYVLDVLTQYTQIETQKIGIDEKRDWKDLYTPREWRNKQSCIDLETSKIISGANITRKPPNEELPDIIQLTDLRYFLENPLKSYAKRVFGYEENDKSNQELEDTEINYLDKHNLEYRLIKPLLEYKKNSNNNHNDCDNKGCPDDLQWLNYKDLLPQEPFGEIEFKKVCSKLARYVDIFLSYELKGKKIKIEANFPINVPVLYKDDKHNKEYVVRGQILMCAYDDKDIILYVCADEPSKDIKNEEQQIEPYVPKEVQKRYYEMYALVAQIAKQSGQPNKEYTVHMVYVSDEKAVEIPYVPDEKPENLKHKGIKMTGAMAETKLNEFYNRMFIKCNNKYLPYFDNDLEAIMSLEDLQDNFNNRFKYNSVSHKNLLKMDTDLGFSKDDFTKEFKEAILDHKKLLDLEFNKE